MKTVFVYLAVVLLYLMIILGVSGSFMRDPGIDFIYFPMGLVYVLCILHYSLNIFMYVELSWHRLLESYFSYKNYKVQMKSYIKSIDEFGIADTFLMDEFSFVEKNILKLGEIFINEDNKFTLFDRDIIL